MPPVSPTLPAVPQNVTLTADQIAALQLTEVPLYIIPCGDDGDGPNKVGIIVGLQQQAATNMPVVPALYEFDTGGRGFWANGRTLGWIKNGQDCKYNIANQYESGITYFAQSTDCNIYLYPTGQSGELLISTSTVGIVGEIYAPSNVAPSSIINDAMIDDNTTGDKTIPLAQFPIYKYFQGDFGVSLAVFQKDTSPTNLPPFAPQVTGTPVPLLGALSQLSLPDVTGFVVDLANVTPAPASMTVGGQSFSFPTGTTVGRLLLGQSGVLLDWFPQLFNLPNLGSFNNSCNNTNYPFYNGAVLYGNATCGNETKLNNSPVSVILDTGTPTVVFYQGSDLSVPGDTVSDKLDNLLLTVGSDADSGNPAMPLFSISQVSSGNEPTNLVLAQAKGTNSTQPAGSINTGLLPFTQSPVLFGLGTEPTAPGLVGFPAASTS